MVYRLSFVVLFMNSYLNCEDFAMSLTTAIFLFLFLLPLILLLDLIVSLFK